MKYLLSVLFLLCIVGWGPFSSVSISSNAWIDNETRLIEAHADNLDTDVLKIGLKAYLKAEQEGLDRKELLTIIDYTKPSSEKRLWVIDLKHTHILFNTWVTHGQNSGTLNSSSFSNKTNSLKSSLGVFVTDNAYFSDHVGYALRVRGLERGINDNAYKRGVLIHGAWYASADIAKRGALGRSWGCMAVSKNISRPLIDTIKNNTLVVAYYPDRNWLKTSSFLNNVTT
ncbi:MAG TPA: murein L,D-transpeptidase catalytic domain family protein [Gammaproteobacteria bacterium]|nr:murein L,D-transpeptidase catalytic domain family protein [Gammaproteobacteria bacterium]